MGGTGHYSCHCWVPGSHVDAKVPDILTNGLAEYHTENRNVELEMEDLEAI